MATKAVPARLVLPDGRVTSTPGVLESYETESLASSSPNLFFLISEETRLLSIFAISLSGVEDSFTVSCSMTLQHLEPQ